VEHNGLRRVAHEGSQVPARRRGARGTRHHHNRVSTQIREREHVRTRIEPKMLGERVGIGLTGEVRTIEHHKLERIVRRRVGNRASLPAKRREWSGCEHAVEPDAEPGVTAPAFDDLGVARHGRAAIQRDLDHPGAAHVTDPRRPRS